MLATASISVMTPPGLAIDSMKIALVFGDTARSNEADVVGVGPRHVPAEILDFGEFGAVDQIAAIARQTDSVAGFRVRRARLGILTRETANAQHRHAQSVHQHQDSSAAAP